MSIIHSLIVATNKIQLLPFCRILAASWESLYFALKENVVGEEELALKIAKIPLYHFVLW